MPSTRLYIDAALAEGDLCTLPSEALAHVRARRLRSGDEVTLFNGRGRAAMARLTDVQRRNVTAEILAACHHADCESPFPIVLLQGVSKGDRMDTVVQKSVELGVAQVVPVFTAHGVVRLDGERARRKQSHWQRVAVSACEQCGRNTVPEVSAPVPLGDALATMQDTAGLVLAPDGDTTIATLPRPSGSLTVLIGPEGGLTEGETGIALSMGWHRLRLGPRVLRTETAALVALATLQARFGDLGAADTE